MMRGVVELCNLGCPSMALDFAFRIGNPGLIKLAGDTALRHCDFETARAAYNELAMLKIDNPEFNYKEYQDCYTLPDKESRAEYLRELQTCDFLKNLVAFNNSHNNDPAALSLFINELCINENDLNTSMALALLIACPDVSQDDTLNKAEKLLLMSNKPSLALSFRVDSLDWATASTLAMKISSPYIRETILIQQAGELESKQQF